MVRRMIIDMSSLLWQSLFAGKDEEFGTEVIFNDKKVWINSYQHGYECAMNHLTSVMDQLKITPINMIFVVEGQNSKARRKAMYPGYKEKSDKPTESYNHFNILKQMMIDTFRGVGATMVSQDGVESDDVIAYLCQHLKGDKIIVSRDGDLCALLSDEVMQVKSGQLVIDNPYGPFPPKYVTTYKALVGDSSDNIKGAPGFGETAFVKLLEWAGESGLEVLEGLIKKKGLHTLEEDVPSFKPMRKIIDGADSVYTSYDCAKLHPEWVNTLRVPLQWKPGMVRNGFMPDVRLKKYCQSVTLVTMDNFDEAKGLFQRCVGDGEIVSLDIEASTPDESDDWLRQRECEDKFDGLGFEMDSMALTFGDNHQYTLYFSVNHAETNNITKDMLLEVIKLIPPDVRIVIQNWSFEGPNLYKEFGEALKDNGWYGFLPNVIDTAIMSSYVDENVSSGLKQNSKLYLNYDQVDYKTVTTLTGPVGTLPAGGKLVSREPVYCHDEDGEVVTDEQGEAKVDHVIHTVQYKMRELSGDHVLNYGADDTICTSALFNYYRLILEIEDTWDLLNEIEIKPQYLTNLAYTQGIPFNLERMNELAAADRAAYEKSWAVVRDYLISIGWEGTVTPVYTELTPANVKDIVELILGERPATMARKLDKIGKFVAAMDHDDAEALGQMIELERLDLINAWVAQRFDGEPKLDVNSPKQMRHLLYTAMKLPIRLVNPLTENERTNKKELSQACYKHGALNRRGLDIKPVSQEELDQRKKAWMCLSRADQQSNPLPLTLEDVEFLKAKGRTDDTSIDFALAFDLEAGDPRRSVLDAMKLMKTVDTRNKMFYKPYAFMKHWKTGKLHPSARQCGTVTRRWSYSDPNAQQWPKRDGATFRECIPPHHKDAIVCSCDFAGQELRGMAGLSLDPALLSCYVGENLKDMHSITASGAMKLVWSKETYNMMIGSLGDVHYDDEYLLFMALRRSSDKQVARTAKDLRTLAKTVGFGSAYGCKYNKMQETLVTDLETATNLLDTKYNKFSGYEKWKNEVEAEAERNGYVKTRLGGIRHLRDKMLSEQAWERAAAARQASNFQVQSGGAELMKKAMCRIWDSGIFFKLDAVFYAVIHDEVVWSVHRDHAWESIVAVWNAVSQPYYDGFAVPFYGSVSLGKTLGDQIEYSDDPVLPTKEWVDTTIASLLQ